MTSPNELTAWGLLTATAGLLAFLVSLYALVGRERKSPYLINSIFFVFLICLIGAMFDLGALLVPKELQTFLCFTFNQDTFLKIGVSVLLFAFAVAAWKIWTAAIRLTQFVDPKGIWYRIRHLAISRGLKRIWSRLQGSPQTYSHNPLPLDAGLKAALERVVSNRSIDSGNGASSDRKTFELRRENERHSLALALRHQGQANQVLMELAVEFLKNDNYVQYMTASRHPIEFIKFVKDNWADQNGKNWNEVSKKIIVIDAFTAHFGFTDSIHGKRTDQLVSEFGVDCINSAATFAGIHTAASEAFKKIQKKEAGGLRKPALVIYEDCYALADLESVEQYRIFVRHVMPSERLWDAMFTVFAETAQPEAEWGLVSSYASMMLDMRSHWPQDQNAA